MWFLVAFFVAGFLLTAFLTPKMKGENAKAAGLDDFNFPRSKEGDAVGRFYGTVKHMSPNTIALAGYRGTAIKKKVKTGLFSSKRVITGYRYNITVDLAWALGPGVVYRRLWFGDNLVWSGCHGCADYNPITINLPELYGGSEDGKRGGIGGDIVFYCGNFDQPRDSYMEANVDADIPAYRGVAHMVFRDFWWGNTSSLDAVSVEATYFTNSLGLAAGFNYMENGYDANAIEVLHDIITSGWGNLGFNAAKINTASWRDIAYQVYEEGVGISLSIANATQGTEVCKQILRQLNAIIYEDTTTGLVEIALLRNDYDIDDLEVLTPAEIVEVRNYTKKQWSETNNVVRVKYTDRSDNYARDKIATAKDSSLLRFQGRVRPIEVQMPGLYVGEWANIIAARELSNVNIPLFSAELICKRLPASLKPGKPFIMQWPEYGIAQMIMRIRKMNMGEFEDGKITLSVLQDEFSSDATVIAAPVPSAYEPPNTDPFDIAEFRFFELPAFLDYKAALGTRVGYTRWASFAVAPTSYTIGYSAYVDETPDDATVLTDAPYTDYATLVTPIGRFDGWNDGVVTAIQISGVTNPDVLPVEDSVRQGGGLILIGNELLAYESFTDDTGGFYTLNNVHRAFLDTGWFAHAAAARVWFFDGQEGFFDTDTLIGAVDDTYLLDKTISGSSPVDSAIVTTLTAQGRITRVIAPDYATVDGVRDAWQTFGSGVDIEIDARPRNRNDIIEAWFEDDAASTAEAGTLYRISFELDGVVTVIDDDVTLPYTLTTTDDMVGACIVLIEAKLDGLYSIAAAPMPIAVSGGYGEGYGFGYGG